MPVDLAVDDDLTRAVELCRITVGRRERQQIESSVFMSAPRQCMSFFTSRAMVTGA